MAECGLALEANAEQHLRSRGRLAALYEPEWLHNTLLLAGQCRFSLGELRYEYPQEIVPAGETPASYLRKLTYAGAERRFGGKGKVDRATARPRRCSRSTGRRSRASSRSSPR